MPWFRMAERMPPSVTAPVPSGSKGMELGWGFGSLSARTVLVLKSTHERMLQCPSHVQRKTKGTTKKEQSERKPQNSRTSSLKQRLVCGCMCVFREGKCTYLSLRAGGGSDGRTRSAPTAAHEKGQAARTHLAVAVEDVVGHVRREVLELDQRVRVAVPHCVGC